MHWKGIRAGNPLDFDFDLILDLGDVPASGVVTRTYRAGHNLGWYRFVGYTALGPNGQPLGDVIPLADVRFPFDPFLQGRYRLDGIVVERWGYGPVIEESSERTSRCCPAMKYGPAKPPFCLRAPVIA